MYVEDLEAVFGVSVEARVGIEMLLGPRENGEIGPIGFFFSHSPATRVDVLELGCASNEVLTVSLVTVSLLLIELNCALMRVKAFSRLDI